jgi:proteasome lid subunit RPN8/RPN11
MGLAPGCVRLERSQWQEMRDHVASLYPMEACGLIGGEGEFARLVIPVTNEADSTVRFRMDPEQQVKAMLRIEAMGLELMGIYHSHPSGPDGPSEADYREAAYPEAAYLIWYRESGIWRCRAFDLFKDRGAQIPIHVLDEGAR